MISDENQPHLTATSRASDGPSVDLWLDRLSDRLAGRGQRTSDDDSLRVEPFGHSQISITLTDGDVRFTQSGCYGLDQIEKIEAGLDGILSWHQCNTLASEDAWPASRRCLDELAVLNAWLIKKHGGYASYPGSSEGWIALSGMALRRAANGMADWPGLANKGFHVIRSWLDDNRPIPTEQLDDAVAVLLAGLRFQNSKNPMAMVGWMQDHLERLSRADSVASVVHRLNDNALWMAVLTEWGLNIRSQTKTPDRWITHVLTRAACDLTDNQMADLAAGSNLIADHAVFRACLERRTLSTEVEEGVLAVRRRL